MPRQSASQVGCLLPSAANILQISLSLFHPFPLLPFIPPVSFYLSSRAQPRQDKAARAASESQASLSFPPRGRKIQLFFSCPISLPSLLHNPLGFLHHPGQGISSTHPKHSRCFPAEVPNAPDAPAAPSPARHSPGKEHGAAATFLHAVPNRGNDR